MKTVLTVGKLQGTKSAPNPPKQENNKELQFLNGSSEKISFKK